MENKQILPIEITMKEKKTSIRGYVLRAAVFSPFKVIEVKTVFDEKYYLISFKDSLVFGGNVQNIQVGSFIDQAFHKGIVLESTHPFLPAFISSETIMIPNKAKLFSKLQSQYTLLEVAYMATALDSFFTKDQLMNMIDKIYFHYRRSGKFFKAFQILKVLSCFSPQNPSVKDRIHSKEFYPYTQLYNTSPLSKLYQKDPLFVELHCFENRINPEENKLHRKILTEHNRPNELLLLWMEKVQLLQQIESLENYSNIALQSMSMKEWISILCYLKVNPFKAMSTAKTTIDEMISLKQYEVAASYLFPFINDLPDRYHETLTILFQHLDIELMIPHLDRFLVMLEQLAHDGKLEQFELKLLLLIEKWLKADNLQTVYKKLQPIYKCVPNSLLLQKLKRMMELVEDPDHMMELGQCYADFHQYDEAIECFSWEMELHPEDPSPVRQISKMYGLKGMTDEASAYQQLYVQLIS